ncbi:DNA glycosylase [Neolentinus lepideus HHB14362 ss-1]|uniref:DNA glycosylase n=1 Tax=Neolentinus lepideus HHB14362 ss-1 TaxID=1314782 RepID=A0A165PKA2_9AGAM|nr:DNA glycosylase [Neolentinus lepideus HHB14362 ss-1]
MPFPITPKKSTRDSPYFSPPVAASRYFHSASPHLNYSSPQCTPRAARDKKRTVNTVLAEVDLESLWTEENDDSDASLLASFEFERSLVHDSAFLCFGDLFIQTYDELWRSKPILIQEHVDRDPWKLLVATMFLNKTSGRYAIPVFWEVVKRWPTPHALSSANETELIELIKPLGLQRQRAKRLIQLSSVYINNPPSPNLLYRSKSPSKRVSAARSTHSVFAPVPLDPLEERSQTVRYASTPISHLPGAGPYALDSYRIFCAGRDEWKNVRPSDKELIKYLRWKWAVTSFDLWDPDRGVVRKIELSEMQSLIAELSASRGCHGLDIN